MTSIGMHEVCLFWQIPPVDAYYMGEQASLQSSIAWEESPWLIPACSLPMSQMQQEILGHSLFLDSQQLSVTKADYDPSFSTTPLFWSLPQGRDILIDPTEQHLSPTHCAATSFPECSSMDIPSWGSTRMQTDQSARKKKAKLAEAHLDPYDLYAPAQPLRTPKKKGQSLARVLNS